jgi:hypothetical protein
VTATLRGRDRACAITLSIVAFILRKTSSLSL